MELYTLLVYSENIAGILNQITAVFTRQQVNIESLNVSASSTGKEPSNQTDPSPSGRHVNDRRDRARTRCAASPPGLPASPPQPRLNPRGPIRRAAGKVLGCSSALAGRGSGEVEHGKKRK